MRGLLYMVQGYFKVPLLIYGRTFYTTNENVWPYTVNRKQYVRVCED
jgi:hypothetical protein